MRYDNYESDYRVRARRRRAGKVPTVYIETDEYEEEIELPTKFEVCPTCEGKGTHVNPSIDCNGLSADDFAEDPDFAESYMSGVYDVPCYECDGIRVVPVVDEARCNPEYLAMYREQEEARRQTEREIEAERRFGC